MRARRVLGLLAARATPHRVGVTLPRAQRLRSLLPPAAGTAPQSWSYNYGHAALFPGYAFVLIVSVWWSARWSPGVRRIVLDGQQPARVPDAVITEIRSREHAGFVELPKQLAPGMRVRVISGPLCDQIGLLGALRRHERVLVLLQLLGGQQRVDLARSVIEAIDN